MGLSQWSSSPLSSSFFMHAFILFWWCGLLVTSVVGGNNETDRLALLAFKAKITDDPLQVLSSWNDSFHFCQWRGVTCGRRHQRVTTINLPFLKLVGSISPYVRNLSILRNLTLQNNSFIFEIPQEEIGRLHKLQYNTKLDLYHHALDVMVAPQVQVLVGYGGRVRGRVQVSRREFHIHIHLNLS